MTSTEAAKLLAVSPRYVRQLIEQGRLSRTGKANHRLDPAEVRRLAAQRKRGAR